MTTQTHRILVVGAGSIGERHTRCYLATNRATLGICESNPERRAMVADRYGIAESYARLDDALAQSWDAVLIATPAQTHVPIAMQAAEAGANLYIEKPLAIAMDGVDALRERVRAAGLLAAVGYHFRAHPGLQAMKEALDSGRFGRPLEAYGLVGQRFANYRPAYREVYFADHAQGGGAIQDAMTHLLNLAEWLVGPITRLVADAEHQYLDGVNVEDTVHVLARHGGVMGTYTLNLYQNPNEAGITVVCSDGVLRFSLDEGRWRAMGEPDGLWEDHPCRLPDRDAWYVANAHAYLDALERRAEPLCSLDDGVQSLRVNLAALRSTASGAWQNVEQK